MTTRTMLPLPSLSGDDDDHVMLSIPDEQQPQQLQSSSSPLSSSQNQIHRDTLHGCWVLDKTRGEWSMKQYLEVMNVDPLAIEANCKGEIEFHTIQSIELIDNAVVRIMKRSRVNNDIVIELRLHQEHVEYLPPGNRIKRMIATTGNNNFNYLHIKTNIETMNGFATVIDIKRLIQENDTTNNVNRSVLVQELTITNDESKQQHTTIRYFNPIPHMDYYENTTTL